MPEYDANDKLTLTLDTLRSDVERTPLADSMTIRRHGDQRTRRQAVGGAVAVVALVAGIAGVLGGAGGFNRADAPPATDDPTASTEVEQPLALAADPLLTPTDLGTVGPYEGWQVNTDTAAVEQQQSQCVPSPTILGGAETVSELLYGDLDAQPTEHVVRFGTATQAQTALQDVSAALAECTLGSAGDNPQYRGGTEVTGVRADAAVRSSRTVSPPDSEVSYFELGLVRRANVLVVLQWHSMGNPFDDGTTWVWSAERLQAALDAATADA
jgi:hypothetical protein